MKSKLLIYGLWIMDYGLWIMDYGLWIMDYGLWIMDYGLWIIIYKSLYPYFSFGNFNYFSFQLLIYLNCIFDNLSFGFSFIFLQSYIQFISKK